MSHKRNILFLSLLILSLAGLGYLLQAQWADQHRNAPDANSFADNSNHPVGPKGDCIYHGYWDHLRGPDGGREFAKHFNIGKSSSVDTVDEVVAQGIPAIAMVGGFNPDRPEFFEERILDKAEVLSDYSADTVPIVLLMDEPYLKGFTKEQLEEMIRLSNEILNRDGNGFQFTFSFARASIMRDSFQLPNNIELAWVNWYPFYEREYPAAYFDSERQFKRDFARKMDPVFKRYPEVKWFVTGQAFGDYVDVARELPKWRRPPLEAPEWYARLAVEYPEIVGLIWWVWQSRHDGRWTGTDQMPELYEAQKKASEILCELNS
jgi:hypothetical protein